MSNKQQLLKEAKILETKLAKVKKQIAKEETLRMQKLAGVITEINEQKNNPNRLLELIGMYVDNYYDEGMNAEAALRKIDELLQGNLDDYDKAFMVGKEDEY